MRLLGLHQPPGQRQFDGARQPQDLAHDPGAGDAGNARVDLGLPHPDTGVTHADVGQQDELKGRACRHAVQRRDDRNFQRANGPIECAETVDPGIGLVRRAVQVGNLGIFRQQLVRKNGQGAGNHALQFRTRHFHTLLDFLG